MVGVWISVDKEWNEVEINVLVKLVKDGLVDIVVVGNEVLLCNELFEQEIIGYIEWVKALLFEGILVGYVDVYYQFLECFVLVSVCDIIFINCYFFWEGVDSGYVLLFLQQMYVLAKEVGNGKKVIVVEIGWLSVGQNVEVVQLFVENVMKYFINVQDWVKVNGIEMFYFFFFDEFWKVVYEGEVGICWGFWDKYEQFKFVL